MILRWISPTRFEAVASLEHAATTPISISHRRPPMPTQNAHTAESSRTRLLGFHDLQGRESLQVALQGDWCYVGHLPGNRPNPLTGKAEDNGTSILDISNPAKPTLIAHIPP